MNYPLISIIVLAYNVEKHIDRCLKSICHQTFKNIEITIINDGSVDNTPTICNQWTEMDKRIKVIHTQNNGVAEARNIGLKYAKGEFIGFVDGDDWIGPEMFETLYKSMQKHHSQISICGVCNDNSNGKLRHYQSNEKTERVWNNHDALKEIFIDRHLKNYL